jgi:hypothetical protein
MPREKFLNYYIDMLIMQDSLGRDSVSTQRIMTELNKKYDVTPKEYQATLDYYRDEPKEWSVFFDEAVTLVQKRQMEQRQTLSR